MSAPPLIVGAACTFPSGSTLELADAAVRAQLSLLQRHPEYFDQAGEHCRGSFFPIESPFNTARWALLADAALEQLATSMKQSLRAELRRRQCSLWLVLPDVERRPGLPDGLPEAVTARVKDGPFTWERIATCTGGHAAGIRALCEAADYLTDRPDALAVVLGVESGLSRESMLWLDMQSLLHGARSGHQKRVHPQPYGRVPGEGAAAVALTGIAPRTGVWGRLLGSAVADEPATYASAQVCTGAGLTLAARAAVKQARSHGVERISSVMADLNGEPYRADQFGFTTLRLARVLAPQWQRSLPALASGDMNAASSVAHVALAAYASRRQNTADAHLILASSDDPLRGAAVIGAPDSVPILQERHL